VTLRCPGRHAGALCVDTRDNGSGGRTSAEVNVANTSVQDVPSAGASHTVASELAMWRVAPLTVCG
jgi:hypothetical protein